MTETLDIRAIIEQAEDIPEETVPVPEWGGVELLIRGLDGGARARFIQTFSDDGGRVDLEQAMPDLIIATAFNPAAPLERVFQPDDHALLNSKSGAVTQRLVEKAMALSGLTEGSVAEAGKDSSETTSADSSTS